MVEALVRSACATPVSQWTIRSGISRVASCHDIETSVWSGTQLVQGREGEVLQAVSSEQLLGVTTACAASIASVTLDRRRIVVRSDDQPSVTKESVVDRPRVDGDGRQVGRDTAGGG